MPDDDNWCCGCCCGFLIACAIMDNGDSQPIQLNLHDTIDGKVRQEIVKPLSTQDRLLARIDHYQKYVSPQIKEQFGDVCRYTPSCSEYGKQAITKYGSAKGAALTIARLARCNPLSKGGHDPLV